MRLEDDVLVRTDGVVENLSLCPRTIEEIRSVKRGGPWPPVADACRLACGELLYVGPVFLLMVGALLLRRGRSIYMLDFALFEPPESWRITHEELLTTVRNISRHRAAAGLARATCRLNGKACRLVVLGCVSRGVTLAARRMCKGWQRS